MRMHSMPAATIPALILMLFAVRYSMIRLSVEAMPMNTEDCYKRYINGSKQDYHDILLECNAWEDYA